MTSQYVYGKVRKITEIAECVTLRYEAQQIYTPCGKADPGDHSGQLRSPPWEESTICLIIKMVVNDISHAA